MIPNLRNSWDFSRASIRWDETNQLSLINLDSSLSPSDANRLRRYRDLWNHYEGFHWEDIEQEDKPQVTLNYCRVFVNKFTSFLFGLHDQRETGFTVKVPTEMERITLPFLNSVWDAEHNGRRKIASELGQCGGVTGDAYILVRFERPGEFPDPFGEYPNGRIKVRVLSPHIVFPFYDPSDRDRMLFCEIKYPVLRREETGFFSGGRGLFNRPSRMGRTIVYRQVWYPDRWEEYEGEELVRKGNNPYGVIPIVHIRNMSVHTSNFGVSDLEDVIPINKEINFKVSNNSEIIDYHSAPVTLVFGARVSSLERGANKVWGNLPVNSKVENLELKGDLAASINHIKELKESMFEIASIPVNSLGGSRGLSNTSGVALQIEYAPILEKVGYKRITYSRGLRQASRLILLIGVVEGLIEIPSEIEGRGTSNARGNDIPETTDPKGDVVATASNKDTNDGVTTRVTDPAIIRRLFYDVDIETPDSMPKDKLLELEKLQAEIAMNIENRTGAMKRLGVENVEQKLAEIDADRMEEALFESRRQSLLLGLTEPLQPRTTPKIVSGFNNGPEPKPDLLKGAQRQQKSDLERAAERRLR